ncbi:Chymotrypsinogen B [Halotydeus destructor]|nr:Chymotrypsinogen B [Halotydeus destructor]
MSGVWAPFCVSLIFLRATFADPLACNGSERTFSLSSTDGTLVSPGYDLGQPYPDDLHCNWVILRKLGHAVVVEFESFDLGQNGACLGDSLSFETTDTYTYPKLIKRLCGQHLPRRLYFPIGYNVRIRFQSDFVGLNYGFKAQWHYSDGPPCPAGQVLCRNRKCVMENVTCNGIDDCGDASDETMYCNSVDIPIQETIDCGRQVIQPRLDHIFKVVGGQAAVPGSWPWMVSIQRDETEPSGHFCGGALISSQYVISAAHCTLNMEGKDSVRLVFGKHFYYEDETEIVRYVKDYKIFSQNPAEDKPFHFASRYRHGHHDTQIIGSSAVQQLCPANLHG